jgi:hypothetical protein
MQELMLLFPFRLSADQITFWGFIAVIITVVLTLWSSIAATLAAKFAKDAPTKEDFARLEQHAADTSGHLQKLAQRERAMDAASRISLSVSGRGYDGSDLIMQITAGVITAKLTRIDLYTENGTSYGSAPCECLGEGVYKTSIDRKDLPKWHKDGIALRSSSQLASVKLRVHMEVDGGEGYREMPVTLGKVQVADTRTEAEYAIAMGWEIHGEV